MTIEDEEGMKIESEVGVKEEEERRTIDEEREEVVDKDGYWEDRYFDSQWIRVWVSTANGTDTRPECHTRMVR